MPGQFETEDGQIISLTPEQEAEYNRQAEQTFQQQADQPGRWLKEDGSELKPFQELTAEQLADFEAADPKSFSVARDFEKDRSLWEDPETVQKVASAYKILRKKQTPVEVTRQFLKQTTPSNVYHAGVEFGKGFLKQLDNLFISGVPQYIGAKVGEAVDIATGTPIDSSVEAQRDAQRKIAEGVAATESALFGLAKTGKAAVEMAAPYVLPGAGAARGARKAFGKEKEETPEDDVAELFKKVGEIEQEKQITRGKGEFLQAVGGEVTKELEETGRPIRQQEVESLAAGDPFAFYAFGKGFHGLGKGISAVTPTIAKQAGAALVGDLGDLARVAGGKSIQALGETARVAIGKPVTTAGKVVSAVTPRVVERQLLPPVVSGVLRKGGPAVEKAGAGVAEFGKGVASEVAPTAATQLGKDVLEVLPGVAGEVAKGSAFDLGLAVTAETPSEVHGPGLGVVFGLLGASRQAGGKVLSGQLIAPRAHGSNVPVADSGQFSDSIRSMHRDAYQDAAPGVKARINATRQFLKGVDPEADLFLGRDTESIKQALIASGLSEQQANLYAGQHGFFEINLPDKKGNSRRLIVVKNADAAPHESFHAFQDVLGEAANRQIDETMKRLYADQWEQFGQRYTDDLVKGKFNGRDWRSALLDASGWGYAEALEKATNRAMEARGTSAFDTPESRVAVRQQVAQAFQQALTEAQTAGLDAEGARQYLWRGILTPEEMKATADRYVARELAAENFDAAFKNLGPSLKSSGALGYVANVIGKAVSLFGGEPLSGRTSELLGVPLKAEAVEAVVGAKVPPISVKPSISPGGETVTPGQPIRPTDSAEEARILAEAASDTPTAAGLASPRELLGTIAQAIAGKTGVKINYLSAPEEPAAATTSNRTVRREMIEIFRTMPPSARLLWEKNFFPEKVIQTKGGKYQVQGWAPEVFAANAHKTAKTLNEIGRPDLSPYEIDAKTGSFTEAGWRQLFEDTQAFVRNQIAGATGAGEPLVVPKRLTEAGYFQPEIRGATAGLEQSKADFINMLFGIKLPETPRITTGKIPLNVAGQEVSIATEGGPQRLEVPVRPREPFTGEAAAELGIEGRTILEVNPVRRAVEEAARQAGKPAPSLIEAIQKLNLENIKEVAITPEQPEFRGNILTLSAGFVPMPQNPRAVKGPALRDPETKKVYEGGPMHASIYFDLANRGIDTFNFTDGFVTNSGEFLGREEAYVRALELKQVAKKDLARDVKEAEQLESQNFSKARQFAPDTKLPIEIEGQDGKKYKATFDGYWDLRQMGRGWVPAVTALEDIPGSLTKNSSGMLSSLESKGYKNVTPLPEPGPPKEQPTAEAAAAEVSTGRKTQAAPEGTEAREGQPEEEIRPGRTFRIYTQGYEAAVETGNKELARQFIDLAAEAAERQRTLSMKGDFSEFGDPKIQEDYQNQLSEIEAMRGRLTKTQDALEAFRDTNLAARVWEAGGKLKKAPPLESLEGTGFKNHEELVEAAIEGDDSIRKVLGYSPVAFQGMSKVYGSERDWARQRKRVLAKIMDSPTPMEDLKGFASELSKQPKSIDEKTITEDLVDEVRDIEKLKNELRIKSGFFGKRAPFSQLFKPKKTQFTPAAPKVGAREEESNPVKDVAEKYVSAKKITYTAPGDVVPVNENLAKRIADFYESAKHEPDNAEVKESYRALIDETKDQFEQMREAGYTIEPWTGGGEPYKSSADMVKDVRDNKHLWFLQTSKEFGGEGQTKQNLMLEDSGVEINGQKLPVNDLFRAVHDFFGHAKEGLQFGPKGELNAWREHSAMYSNKAQGALAAETLAQNSWVNYGKHLRNAQGGIPKKGESGYKPLAERPFGEQKNIIVPDEFIQEAKGISEPKSQFAPGKKKLPNAAEEDFEVIHYSSQPSLTKVDPKFFGKGKATATDLRGGAKSYFFVKGSDFGQDEAIFKDAGLSAYETTIRGAKLYDLRQGKPDDLEWRKTVNREEADDIVQDAGYDGIILDTADGRQVVAMFKPVKVGEAEEKGRAARALKGQAAPEGKFSSETFEQELEKIRTGKSGGQTFTAEGEIWEASKPSDIVTMASVNLPAGKVTREEVLKALGPYEELLDEPGIVAGMFSFSKGGAPTVSVDINAVVPQKYRDNSFEFAKDNDQVSFWDAVKNEEVKTGGKGDTKLKSLEEILDAYDQLVKGEPVDVEEIIRQNRGEGYEEQLTLYGEKEVLSSADLARMTKADLAQRYPEAVIPRRRNEMIDSGITESPLYKQSESEEAAVKAFGRRLVEFAREYAEDPSFKLGAEWYEKFTPLLKKEFGKDAQLMAELLAATSPQTNVETNFAYATDALEGFRSGRFDKQVSKFKEGLDKIADGSWTAWYNKQLKAGKIEKPPKVPTSEAFLANWINTYKLKPRQSNGKLYGQHSSPVLQVFARKWLELNKGPKVSNFVKNLLGTGDEATIDLWAIRTMRRVGYQGAKERWRLLPKNQAGVSDKDFFFSQKAFREAAEQLDMKPRELQGALWFAEKKLWSENGWSRLDLGDFREEMKKLPMLRKGIQQRLKKTKAEAKAKPAEALEFGELLVEPRKLNE